MIALPEMDESGNVEKLNGLTSWNPIMDSSFSGKVFILRSILSSR